MSSHLSPAEGTPPTPAEASFTGSRQAEGRRLLLAQERQRRLHHIIAAVNAGMSLDDILRLVRDAAVEAGGFDRAGVLLVEGAGDERQVRGVWGTSVQGEPIYEGNWVITPEEAGLPLLERVAYLLFRDGDASGIVPPGWQAKTVVPTARLPLCSGGETVGILSVDNLLSGRPLAEADIEALLPFCDAAAAAVQGARRDAALREGERRFREVLETVPMVAVILDPEGNITFCNDFLLRLTGWKREEVLGHNWFDRFLPADQREEIRTVFSRSLERQEIGAHRENEILTRRGERRLISWNNTLLHDPRGNVLGATSIGEDITERRRLETQIAAAYERERHTAETLQRSLLLKKPETAFPGLDVDALYTAAWDEALVGGDFFDAFALPENKAALVLGDASGKGLAAAARTVEVKYALRAFLREHPDPARTLERLNQVVSDTIGLDNRSSGTFVVVSLAVVDLASGEAHFSAAGAEPPLLLRADGPVETVQAGGMPLCADPGETYTSATLRLVPGDLILMVTDGITEARRGTHDFLGYTGMTRLAQASLSLGSLHEIGEAILQGARDFAGGTLIDDACLLLARRQ
jgi:PAS domain S-box-containing protein